MWQLETPGVLVGGRQTRWGSARIARHCDDAMPVRHASPALGGSLIVASLKHEATVPVPPFSRRGRG